VFPARDRDLVIAVGNDRQFRALTWVLGIPALGDDPRYTTNEGRVEHRDHLRAELEAALAGHAAEHWVTALSDAGVPAGLVNDVAEAIAFADALGLDPVVELGASRTVAVPIRLSGPGSAPAYRTPPPRLDEHAGADWLSRDIRDTRAPRETPREKGPTA